MDYAWESRKKINDLPDTKISFNDLVVKACAVALKKHPQVNTTWKGSTTRYNHHIHIGVAVAVDDGLVVACIKVCGSDDTITNRNLCKRLGRES